MELAKSDKVVEESFQANLRANNCLVDIKKVLSRWNCRINPMVEISGQGIKVNFSIVPLSDVLDVEGGDGKRS